MIVSVRSNAARLFLTNLYLLVTVVMVSWCDSLILIYLPCVSPSSPSRASLVFSCLSYQRPFSVVSFHRSPRERCSRLHCQIYWDRYDSPFRFRFVCPFLFSSSTDQSVGPRYHQKASTIETKTQKSHDASCSKQRSWLISCHTYKHLRIYTFATFIGCCLSNKRAYRTIMQYKQRLSLLQIAII